MMNPVFMISTSQIQTVLIIAVAVGTALGTIIVTVIAGLYKLLKTQTTNGDGRTLRDAVDDMAKELKQHRSEYFRDQDQDRRR
jgi:hypothetical protein